MEKHKDIDSLWRAYSALYASVVPGTIPGPYHAPAMNIILSCIRAAGGFCGPDYPDKES